MLSIYQVLYHVDFGKAKRFMIQSMRQMAHSWLFKGLMVVLVVSFGIWGIGDMFRGNPQTRVVARVGKVDITAQQLWRVFDQMVGQARQAFGPEFSPAQAKQFGLVNAALDRLIEGSVIDQEVVRLGIDVDDQTVLASLKTKPQFQNKAGVFDPAIVRQVLSQSGMSEKGFLNLEREGIGRRMLGEVFLNNAVVPKMAFDLVYRARAQKRAFEVVSLEHSGFDAGKVPDEKALRDFHQAHEKLFSSPEYRAVTIASLSLADVAKDVTVTDEQLQEEYELHGERLARPERRDILQVVLQDEAKAKKLSVDAAKSGDFSGAAKSIGVQAIPLKQVEIKTILPELSGPVFVLAKGGVSQPVKSSLGWHVMQVVSITPAGMPAFAEIKNDLRETMKRDQAIESATRIVNKLDDELAAGHSLEDIADTLRLRLVKIPALDATGLTLEGKAPVELPHKEDVLRTAFGQNAGETGSVIDDRNGGAFVVRTDEILPSGLKPFEKVRNEVVAAWTKLELERLAAEDAEKIAGLLREGKQIPSLAARKGLTVRITAPLSLLEESRDPALSEQELKQAFSLKQGDAKVIPLKDRHLVVRLNRVVDVQNGDTGAEIARNKVASSLREDVPKEITEEYLKHLRTAVFPVRVNRDALEAVEQRGE
ncbi:MAG: SurA N-terminal domain-containing protein [Bdellovibrionales bacterium]